MPGEQLVGECRMEQVAASNTQGKMHGCVTGGGSQQDAGETTLLDKGQQGRDRTGACLVPNAGVGNSHTVFGPGAIPSELGN